MTRPLVIAPLLAALLALGACAGSDQEGAPQTVAPDPAAVTDADPEPAETPEPQEGEADEAPAASDDAADPDPEAPPAATRGWVEVEGTRYDITELRRCEPFEMDLLESELELTGLGESDGERVQIDVLVQTMAGMPADDVSWAGPEGIFGGPEDADVSFTGDRVSGTATLLESLMMEETLAVSFDLEVPTEIHECR